jgi:hypothetical protein
LRCDILDLSRPEAREGPTPIQSNSGLPLAKNGRIRDDGRMVHDMYLVQVKSPAESKNEWDVYKVLATVPGDDAYRPLTAGGCALVKSP